MKRRIILILAVLVVLSVVLSSCDLFKKDEPDNNNEPQTPTHECVAGEWVIDKYPTNLADGVQVKKCLECGNVLSQETIKASVGLEYTLSGNTYTVKSIGTCKDTNVVIPATYENIPVTAIGNNAFSGLTTLVNITVGEHVNSIGSYAFNNCTSLKNVYLSAAVTNIEANAFNNCSLLDTVHFYGDLRGWLNINFKGDHSNPLTNQAFLYIAGDIVDDLVMPEDSVAVPQYAFVGCDSLKSVTMGESVKSIEKAAFARCTALVDVEIGSDVKSIEDYAFTGCLTLPAIVIPDSVKTVETCAFENCPSLEDIVFGASVSNIGNNAFAGCTTLQHLTFGKAFETIGSNAFLNCYSLRTVDIFDKVQSFGADAFLSCYNLEIINYDGDASTWAAINFSGDPEANPMHTYAKPYFKGVLLQNIVISDIETISTYSFYHCSTATSVNISGVTTIASTAFRELPVLETVVITGDNTTINEYAFSYNPLLKNVTLKGSFQLLSHRIFECCYWLTEVNIEGTVANMYWYLFNGDTWMGTINFNGTMEEWNAIAKHQGGYWDGYAIWSSGSRGTITIHCTDGDIVV